MENKIFYSPKEKVWGNTPEECCAKITKNNPSFKYIGVGKINSTKYIAIFVFTKDNSYFNKEPEIRTRTIKILE